MRAIKIVISIIALALAIAVAVAGPGTRFGIWEYGDGLTILRTLAFPALVAAALAGFAFFAALLSARDLAPLALVAAISAGMAAAVPIKMNQLVESNPFIHDITTDFANPPTIVAGSEYKRKNPPEYLGDNTAPRSNLTVADAQRAAFPDIGPKSVDGDIAETSEIVRKILKQMGMKTLNAGPIENGWTIEATDTSLWFGFIDDFVVRLTSEGAKIRVDVRSKSRVGGSDLGANARRVRLFFQKLDQATA